MADTLRLTPMRHAGAVTTKSFAVGGASRDAGGATAHSRVNSEASPSSDPPTSSIPASRSFRRAAADLWLRLFFYLSENAPWLPKSLRGPVRWSAFAASRQIRHATLANAKRILGPGASAAARRRLARDVVDNFYRFCIDVGGSVHQTREQLLARISHVEGHENYAAARSRGRGLIIVTAHMGSFEVGLASITSEDIRVHVIFRRDQQGGFERQRSTLRHRLGVIENPVDDGWTMWIGLRDALAAGEAVIFQGDRVMPGQRGRPLPFLHGTLEVPTGPVKLSRISGAPVLPIFTIRDPDDRVRVCIEPAIFPADSDPHTPGEDPMLVQLAGVIERYVRQYPQQWLMFEPAFVEDRSPHQNRCRPGMAGPTEASHV